MNMKLQFPVRTDKYMSLNVSIIDILPSGLTFSSPLEHFNFFINLVIVP
jgi:hypothetical protein